MLAALPDGERQRLIGAMALIERLLGAPGASASPAILREPRPGDMGWVVQSHGALYAREYGFDSSFEGLVAKIAAEFLTSFDAVARALLDRRNRRRAGRLGISGQAQRRSRQDCACCWSNRPGADRGSASGWSANASRSRKACGYRKITLWTQSILVAARKIYQGAGFEAGGERAAPQFRPTWSARPGSASCEACSASFRGDASGEPGIDDTGFDARIARNDG